MAAGNAVHSKAAAAFLMEKISAAMEPAAPRKRVQVAPRIAESVKIRIIAVMVPAMHQNHAAALAACDASEPINPMKNRDVARVQTATHAPE